MLFPAYLQGDVAVASIMDQLQRIQKVLHHFDIVVIVRGGGGEVGMACYNNFELCKAIAAYPIPVLTGIGHSTNLTVAEMVAFRNAITPTELGDFLLQSFHDFSAPVTDATRVIRQESRKLLELRFTEFTNRSKDFKNASRNCLNRSNRDLQNTSLKLKGQTSSMTARNQEMVDASFSVLKMSLKRLSLNEKSALESIRDGLNKQAAKLLDDRFRELDKLQGSVRLLDPVNVLRRGYSITSFQGRSLSAVNLPASGDSVTIRTAEAEIAATVEKVRSTPPDSV
jgi:exodeoxyribonuclease VII large subunit